MEACDKPHYPYQLPEGWAWCKLEDLAFYKKGPFGSSLTKAMFVPKGDDTYKVYEQKNAIQKDCTLGTYYITKDKYDSLSGFAVYPFDIIVSCAGTIGETYVLPQNVQEGIINQALMLIRLYSREIEQFYLLYFDFILKEEAKNSSKGTAIKNIPPFDVLKNFYIPIPPLKEQRRILDEISKWMSFVESIETDTSNLKDRIKQAKSKILDLAIHGKLVPQDPTDEPASELLKRINPKAEIACDNGQYGKLPKGWCETTLKHVITIKSGYPINVRNCMQGHYPIYGGNGITGYTVDYNIKEPTIVIGRVGFYCGSVYLVKEKAWVSDNAFTITIHKDIFYKKYLYYLIQFLNLRKYSNSTAQPVISGKTIYPIHVIIPPIDEQHRIVAKVEDIFAQLDTIEASL